MKWLKQGLIFCPDRNYDWMLSHAANPVAEHIGESLFRVYFSCRDKDQRSSIGFIELDMVNPVAILRVSSQPVISPGETGTFDDSGTSVACLVKTRSKKYLFYVGWNLGVTAPWRNSIGLATAASDEVSFSKYSPAPIVDRSYMDPLSLSYPWVIREGALWRMWYGSNLRWGPGQKDMAYVIKYAESSNGIRWNRQGVIAIGLESEKESALARPCVIKEDGVYKMWYSRRGESYRIGYAESLDGISWQRKDAEAGIDVSTSGWDSEMIEYPFVFDHDGKRYMLYNGNDFGKTGVGLAMADS